MPSYKSFYGLIITAIKFDYIVNQAILNPQQQ